EAARLLRESLDPLVALLARRAFRNEDLRAMAMGLVDDGRAGQYRDYAGAEQATMAIGSLLNFLAKRGVIDARAASGAMDALLETVKNDERYRDAAFRDALEKVASVLSREKK